MVASPLTTGGSFTFVTVTVTSNVAVLSLLSFASTVTEYTLLVSASAAPSKSGDDANVNSPPVLIAKSAASVPDKDQVKLSLSGSVAV